MKEYLFSKAQVFLFVALFVVSWSTHSLGYGWEKTFSVGEWDCAYSVQQTLDDGYIIVGYTEPIRNSSSKDIYLIKTDSDGNELWYKTFGKGVYDNVGYSVQQTADRGYIIAGYTELGEISNDDFYLVKTDSDGNESWNKTFWGSKTAYSGQQTADGGYIIAGETESSGAGGKDVYLIKTDANGNETWSKTFGGSSNDSGKSVKQTDDGGYIIAGNTFSFGEGQQDIYLIKTDADGNMDWSKTFGGTNFDLGEEVQQTIDGGYIITGSKQSSLGGPYELYLIKTNALGDMDWSKTFSENYSADGYSVQQTKSGGYIIAGRTVSLPAQSDAYLVYYSPATNVDIDIKPGSCPNSLNIDSKGILTVAAFGTEDFDETDIDPTSVRLEGVAPIRSSIKDIASSVIDKESVCDCTKDRRDGFDDLVLKFTTSEIHIQLGDVHAGDILELKLTGNLTDGTPIEGKDCIVIVK